jgi:excisionase family DNA binding protein
MPETTNLSVRQAAVALSVSQKWVRDLIYEHKVPARKIRGKWQIPASAVAARRKAQGQAEQAP